MIIAGKLSQHPFWYTVLCFTLEKLYQWGTVSLANNGYTPLGILRYYYGSDIQLATASEQRPIGSSYPGSPLRVGSTGEAVRTLETQLNRIRRNYPAIPAISNVDTAFTAETQAAVRAFQRIFNLTPDGIVGPATWNKIAYIYAAVLRLAQLGDDNSRGDSNAVRIFHLRNGRYGANGIWYNIPAFEWCPT